MNMTKLALKKSYSSNNFNFCVSLTYKRNSLVKSINMTKLTQKKSYSSNNFNFCVSLTYKRNNGIINKFN